MKLYEIKPLLKDMGVNGVKQDKFSFRYNNVGFDVVVLIERSPFELLFGTVDANFCFVLKLGKGYELEGISNDVFYKLCEILNLRPGKNVFTSWTFLKHFAAHIPQKYSGRKLEPDEIARYMRHEVDEGEKIYFKGWQTHISDGRQVRNLLKTKRILGDEAYEYCKRFNISSCWGSDVKEKKTYYTPQEHYGKHIAK